MLGQVRKHLHRWTNNQLSLAGRIMVSNQVILSSIWYFASCMTFSNQALNLVRTTIRNYMWSGKKDSKARARVKWATAVLPIVRGGVKILDPNWQASALLVKLLIRGLSVGYEPWKTLVRYRVSQTRQSRRGRWPTNANWIMNNQRLVKQGSSMWQGVMKAWNTIQSGLEQQEPNNWNEIMRQPLFGNRLLTNEIGSQWGTEPRSHMRRWAEKGIRTLQDITRIDSYGWCAFQELTRLRRSRIAPQLYAKMVNSIPWDAIPRPPPSQGQWVAQQEEEGDIRFIYHLQNIETNEADLYKKESNEQLVLLGHKQRVPAGIKEVRVVRTIGAKHSVLDYNPTDETPAEQNLWLWGNQWVEDLEWDPKDWMWRRLGILPESPILNYSTKRGYRIALRQDNNQMPVDAELETAGVDSKTRAKFFNRIWHPYLPRKVSAMQWLVIAEGLPVGAWREKIGLDGKCQICAEQERETLQHALVDCTEVTRAWTLFRQLRSITGQTQAYLTWKDISRGLMTTPAGISVETELQWDTASAFSINNETPWDILRAQLLWAIWRQRVAHDLDGEFFHLGLVLWYAWKNTVYCAMEAYKELHRHKRNEEKRQELLACFRKIWTVSNIFGRVSGTEIKWNLTPPQEFLPQELGAWMAQPTRITRLSPSPDPEAEFTAHPDFQLRVQEFLDDIGSNFPLPPGTHSSSQSQREPPIQTNQTTNCAQQEEHASEGQRQPTRRPFSCLSNQSNNYTAHIRITSPDPVNRENIPPTGSDAEGMPLQTTRRIKSRPKAKCKFGPKQRPHPGEEHRDPDQQEEEIHEIEALLQEIDSTRQQDCPSNTPQRGIQDAEEEPHQAQANRKQRRTKRKCRFGPYSRRKADVTRTPSPSGNDDSAPLREEDPPPPPAGNAQDQRQSPPRHFAPTWRQDIRVINPCPHNWANSSNHQDTYAHPQDLTPIGPDRVTLEPPATHGQSSRYRPTAAEAPRPNPNRFALARMGISEEELNRRVDLEVDEALCDMQAERRLARITSGVDPGLQRVLSKEDCLTLFRATGVPPPGPLWGVYRWAADLGVARFNFDWDSEDFSVFDAYD